MNLEFVEFLNTQLQMLHKDIIYFYLECIQIFYLDK